MSKRALLLRISHDMFQLLIKPSSGVSKHRILKVAVTDPLLKFININFNNGSVTATFSILCFDTPDDVYYTIQETKQFKFSSNRERAAGLPWWSRGQHCSLAFTRSQVQIPTYIYIFFFLCMQVLMFIIYIIKGAC
jgi:hypothetical protein